MIVGDVRGILRALFGGAGILLLIAAVNVAGLLLLRSEGCQRDIAVRTALGASSARLGARLALLGIVIGLTGAVATAQALRGLLFGVRSGDAATLGPVAGILAIAALAATFLPARRAAAVNPVDALRAE